MDDECIGSSEPIFELASECERLFSQQVARLKDGADANATKAVGEFQQRFSAWAAFLGVFAMPERCLDRKLEHHVEIQDLVLRLLDVMKRNLTYLFEAPGTSNEEDAELTDSDPASPPRSHFCISVESLRGIEGAMERLHHLGGTIQLSSEASQVAKIGKFASRVGSSSFEQLARLAIGSFYPDASPSLLEHVARAMADMSHRFHYWQSRRTRLQARPPVTLTPINEESASSHRPDSRTANAVLEPASLPAIAVHRQRPPPMVRSHLGARSHQSRDSKPTSLDSQEFKRHISEHTGASVKSKTRSILAAQMAYPPQSKDSLTCDWCFSPLSEGESKGENWRKHLNEDFKPFVCISENCSQPLTKFATSRAWFSHMLETHGQHWHRQVHLPAWYICPLCNSQDTTYPRSSDLAEHLEALHGDVFTKQQIQIIVHQSRLRAPRSQDMCPLCCLSMTVGQESDTDDQALKKMFPDLAVQVNELGESHKRIKTEAGGKQRNQNSVTVVDSTEQAETDASAPSSPDPPPLPFEAIAKHVASHLQGIMLLALRMMVLEFAPETSADEKSLSGGTDDGLSRFGSTQQLSQLEFQDIETRDKPEAQDDGDMDTDDPLVEDFIPDCEHEVDWQDVMLNDEPSPEADAFLQQVIDSGAFQIKNPVPSSVDAAMDIRQPQRLHPQRGVIISLPFRRDPFFTGHKSLLHSLIQRCSSPPSQFALVGLGGIGKTHLAIELAHRIVLSADTSVFWIRADTQSRIEEGFGGIASNTKSWKFKAESSLKAAFDWLSDKRNGRWLIILDDANEYSLRFFHYNPDLLYRHNGTILVTTRHKQVGRIMAGPRGHVVEMEPMAVSDAIALLGQKLGHSRNTSWRAPRSTSNLVKTLGLSPLTICRAADYIQSVPAPEDKNRENGESEDEDNEDAEDEDKALSTGHHARYPWGYTEPERLVFELETSDGENWRGKQEEEEGKQQKAQYEMAHKFKELLDSEQEKIKLLEFEPAGADGKEALDSILAIWQTSFRAVRSERSSAAELLSLMSFFDRRGIPKWLLELRRRNDPRIYEGASENNDINSDIETLLNHCIMSSNATKDIFSMPGLIQLAVKRSINHSTRHTYEHLFFKRLEEAFPRDVYSHWATCEELFAHVRVAANLQPTSGHLLGYWASLLYHAARFARAQSNYEVAMKMADQASKARRGLEGESMGSLAASSLIALILMDQGLYDRAEKILADVAGVCRVNTNSIDDASRTTSMHNLACIYKLMGRWNEAKDILVETTKERRTTLGGDHRKTLSSMANLASLYRAQGRYDEAQRLLLRVFVSYTGNLGPDHPQTLASMNDLASIYRLLGKLDEAEIYQKQALDSRKMIFGPDHPDTLTSMNGLASTYRLQGRLDEAEALQEQTLEARKRVLGLDHPSTLASMNNLALILNDQGKHGVASKLQSQVHDTCKEKFGPEHPHTLTSMNNLALIWRNRARHALTRWTMQSCVDARRRVLGPEHPYTVSSARIAESWASEKERMAGS